MKNQSDSFNYTSRNLYLSNRCQLYSSACFRCIAKPKRSRINLQVYSLHKSVVMRVCYGISQKGL